ADELQEGVVHEREGAECQPRTGAVGGHARRDVDDLDADERKILEDDAPGVAKIARQARQVVDQHGLEGRPAAPADMAEHPLKLSPVEVRARDRRVGVLGGDDEAARRGVLAAAPKLVLDGTRVLPIGGVAGVEGDGDGGAVTHWWAPRRRRARGSHRASLPREARPRERRGRRRGSAYTSGLTSGSERPQARSARDAERCAVTGAASARAAVGDEVSLADRVGSKGPSVPRPGCRCPSWGCATSFELLERVVERHQIRLTLLHEVWPL